MDQKRIRKAFLSDRRGKTVAGMNDSLVGKRHDFVLERMHDLLERPTPQIGAADAS